MAAIDKLYASFGDYREFIVWCIIHKPSLLKNVYDPFYPAWDNPMREQPIAYFSHKQDRYLYWHCPLDFVREYLREQCGYKDNWFVKLFWKK